ncbi:hypothetical protein VQ042_20915 [Aurantimonas sp. A2-1-M11]|uniref:hypothetical protein n=1 Tax=Aurantimonas sp. A2-1-M11 TaxID=3113712 RepID=UPI002F95F9C1
MRLVEVNAGDGRGTASLLKQWVDAQGRTAVFPGDADTIRQVRREGLVPESWLTLGSPHHVHILTMNGDSCRLRQSAGRRRAAAARAEQNQATAETVDPDTGEITDP